MALSIAIQPAFSPGSPQRLFDGLYEQGMSPHYDVSADGKRFVLLRTPDTAGPPITIHVVQNWFEEFRGAARERQIAAERRAGPILSVGVERLPRRPRLRPAAIVPFQHVAEPHLLRRGEAQLGVVDL